MKLFRLTNLSLKPSRYCNSPIFLTASLLILLTLFSSESIAQPTTPATGDSVLVINPVNIHEIDGTSPNLLFQGNGSLTDRTKLFQNAVNQSARYGKVLFLEGDIRVSDTIDIPSNAILFGLPGAIIRSYESKLSLIHI